MHPEVQLDTEGLAQGWVPLLGASEVPKVGTSPIIAQAFKVTMVVFRLAGRLGILQNRCPHQGIPLSFGHIEEFGVQCALHGWAFDTNGERSDPAAAFRPASVRAYPAAEAGGLVWAYLGEGAPGEAPSGPESSGTWTSNLTAQPAAAMAAQLAAAGRVQVEGWPLTFQRAGQIVLLVPQNHESTTVLTGCRVGA